MRFAYADPPYLGTSAFGAAHHYSDHHEQAADYDRPSAHLALVEQLVDEFPDGWALSLSSPSLRTILPFCPPDVRVCSWVKGWCSWKPGVSPKYAWEPVILRGGAFPGEHRVVRDWLMCNVSTGQKLPGVKPPAFCRWVFGLLGAGPSDELVDLFPGSGAVSRAWEAWRMQPSLALAAADVS